MSWNEIKINMEIKRIKNILSLTDYKNNELGIFLNNLTDNQISETVNSETFSQSEIFPQDVSSLFKKPWNKLPIVHQIIKIKEFCEKISNNKNKKITMEKELINKLKNKKLHHSQINYDENYGRIISINNLKQLCNSNL